MCHELEWRAWELVKDREREVEEPRVEAAEPRETEAVEPDPETERELVHA